MNNKIPMRPRAWYSGYYWHVNHIDYKQDLIYLHYSPHRTIASLRHVFLEWPTGKTDIDSEGVYQGDILAPVKERHSGARHCIQWSEKYFQWECKSLDNGSTIPLFAYTKLFGDFRVVGQMLKNEEAARKERKKAMTVVKEKDK